MKAEDTDKIADLLFRRKYIELIVTEQLRLDQAISYIEKVGIRKVAEWIENPEVVEVGRKAIEDVLVEWRDNRLSEFARGNGLVIREKDGGDSSIIRLGPETALKIGIKAMLQAKLKEWGMEE